jgi:hypothetical protein
MTSRNFSSLDDINYSFDQMEALGATIDDIGFSGNYYERISLLGESHVVINPKLIIQLLSTLIGNGFVYIKVPASGEIISIEGIYSLIQNILGDQQTLSSILGNKDIIASMEGEQNLASAIQGMRDYISTFKGEFIRIE